MDLTLLGDRPLAPRAIHRNFLFMTICFAVNHGCVISVLNLSVVLLGTEPIERQLRRFSAAGSANLWEQEDELFWRAAFRDAALHPACHRLGGGCARRRRRGQPGEPPEPRPPARQERGA